MKALFLLLNFKWRSAAEEDSGALRTSRNPRSGKRRRRRSEEEEEALHQVVREDSVPLPINKEALEVCLVNRRVERSEGLDNTPEVASWVDSGSRNNKAGASRRERSQTRVASGTKASVNLDKDVITSTCARRAAARRTGR